MILNLIKTYHDIKGLISIILYYSFNYFYFAITRIICIFIITVIKWPLYLTNAIYKLY